MNLLPRPFAWAAAVVLTVFAPAALAGDYYVKIGGVGGGTSWADAFGTIQAALDAVSNAVDTNATVYIGKTTATPYAAVAKSFTNQTMTVRLLAGYDPDTALRDGTSEIAGAGTALDLRAILGTVSVPNSANFVLSHFVLRTSSYGLYTYTSPNNGATFTASNCVITSESTTVSPIYLVSANSGTIPQPNLILESCTVTNKSGSAARAVWLVRGTPTGVVPGASTIRNSLIVASSSNPALSAEANSMTLTGSTVINNGTGLAVYAASGTAQPYTIQSNTLTSVSGNGLHLIASDFSPSSQAASIADSTITAGGTNYAVCLEGWGSTVADSGLADFVIASSTLRVTGDGGIGVDLLGSNGGAMDVVVTNSTIHGKNAAFRLPGAGVNRGNDTFDFRDSTFSAGDQDGSGNSTNAVVLIPSINSATVVMDRTVVKNGTGGINLKPGNNAYLTMINCAVTDQTDYGIRLDSQGNFAERLGATNCTFSGIGGAAVVFGDNGTSTTLEGIFRNCAFAPGGSATNFVNEDADRSLALTGAINAFYQYGTFSAGTVGNSLTGSIDSPAGDAGLSSDGYHLQNSSGLINRYTVAAGDPVIDIDGQKRPIGYACDIGADEFKPPAGTVVFLK